VFSSIGICRRDVVYEKIWTSSHQLCFLHIYPPIARLFCRYYYSEWLAFFKYGASLQSVGLSVIMSIFPFRWMRPSK
jgi:hypothetical protein